MQKFYNTSAYAKAKNEEAHATGLAEGRKAGLTEGQNKKALEGALLLIQKYNATPEQAALDMGVSVDLVTEALNKK